MQVLKSHYEKAKSVDKYKYDRLGVIGSADVREVCDILKAASILKAELVKRHAAYFLADRIVGDEGHKNYIYHGRVNLYKDIWSEVQRQLPDDLWSLVRSYIDRIP